MSDVVTQRKKGSGLPSDKTRLLKENILKNQQKETKTILMMDKVGIIQMMNIQMMSLNRLKICLQLIWVTLPVKRLDFFFTPDDTAAYICQYVFDHWPEEWKEATVTSAHVLKLIHQGRFLHGSVSIGALNLPLGKRSVMHLVARENLPEPPSQGQAKRDKTERRSRCCSIL